MPPPTWATMPVTADHSADIVDYPIGWTWSAAPAAVAGDGNATGTGKFGFRVYKNVSGTQSLGVNEFSVFNAKIRYRVVVTNPVLITDTTITRLLIELRCLSYAASNPLPTIGSTLFGTSSPFGTIAGMTNITSTKVRGIQWEQESENDPSIWALTYTVSPPSKAATSRPESADTVGKPNIEEAPWLIGPEIHVEFGTEDFVLGLGRFIATKTPAELNTALENETYASLFDSSGEFDIVKNSAGDPFESPPPMKTGTATIRIVRAFQSLPAGLTDAIKAARYEVCGEDVEVNGTSFAAYTCKLGGGSVVNKRWKKNAEWLPKQKHPLGWTYSELGWKAPEGKADTEVAVNYTRNALPAFEYLDYYEVSLSIAQRDLGWGYALIDKGYRERKPGAAKPKDITDFSGKQTHSRILAEGVAIDTATGTADKKVLRLYQVAKVGTALSTVLTAVLGE